MSDTTVTSRSEIQLFIQFYTGSNPHPNNICTKKQSLKSEYFKPSDTLIAIATAINSSLASGNLSNKWYGDNANSELPARKISKVQGYETVTSTVKTTNSTQKIMSETITTFFEEQ